MPESSQERVLPYWPSFVRTLGAMIERGTKVRVYCDKCEGCRDVDLAALAAKVGLDYSLINRRCRCRITRGCRGWNRFGYLAAAYFKLWDRETSTRWMLERPHSGPKMKPIRRSRAARANPPSR